MKLEKEIVSEGKIKPVRDEQTLAKLLEAAYVLQEHNREMLEMELRLDLRPEQLEQTQSENPSEKDQLEKYLLKDEKRSLAGTRTGASQTQEGQPTAKTDYSSTLAEIVSTQHQIQVRHLELDDAMSLVTERLTQIARASGAMVGILNGKKVQYRAASGLTLPAGTEVPMEKALCFSCLETGQVLRCGDVHHEDQLDLEECRWRGIQSLIAVPIFHDGEVAGGLELYYPNPRAFTDHDVHTCQLMAGLVTEALAHDKEVNLKKSLASERAVMLQALEKLHPNLAALVDISGAKDAAAKAVPPAAKVTTSPAVICRKCGHKLVGEEQFCGNCGTPRSSDYEPPSMQSKVASLWHMQEAMKKSAPAPAAPVPAAKDEPSHEESIAHPDSVSPDPVSFDAVRFEKPLADALQKQVPDLLAAAELLHEHQNGHENTNEKKTDEPHVDPEFDDSAFSDLELSLAPAPTALGPAAETTDLEPTAIAPPARPTTWSSAATARAFLEQLAAANRPGGIAQLWNTHRGDIYLAIAVILVICVMGWGLRSTHSVSATGNAAAANHHKPSSATVPAAVPAPAPAPDAGLSLFDRMLIRMGLAEPPAAPEYKGNPATQVWVDLHTALYYCPGADLYGKTAKGKFASQRDAQLDQFEPAYRKACD